MLFTFCSVTQKFVILFMIEAKLAAGVMAEQEMLYVYNLLELISLDAESPMLLEIDYSGTVANSWSVSGCIHRVDVYN